MATATVTLTMSPTASSIMCQSNTISPPTLPCFQRRSSIRRGTISSLSKDVRVNDFVDIIKKQKAIQQKERDVDTTSLLRRRHSMLNMSNRIPNKKASLPSRIRTMSNGDLKATAANADAAAAAAATDAASNNSNTDNATAVAASPHAATINKVTSGRIRLDEKNKGKCKSPTTQFSQEQQPHLQQETVISHLRKCAACHENNKESNLTSKEASPTTKAEAESPPVESSITSASFSSDDNTLSNCSSLRSYSHNDDNSLSDVNSRRSSIIKELNQCMSNYSTQMSQMLNQKENSNIQVCKSLIAQQQELLNQLEELNTQSSRVNSPAPPSTSSMDLLKSIFAVRPKTQVVIRQKADKNEADTIFSLQGVCTTTDKTCYYIPDELKTIASTSNQYTYTVNLTHQDRLTKFVLKPVDQWQVDHQVDVCQDKQCEQGFNWFQRKHHCRGCGNIYCNTHSSNRLPLFTGDASASKPNFSRVCDACFYHLVGDSLKPLY